MPLDKDDSKLIEDSFTSSNRTSGRSANTWMNGRQRSRNSLTRSSRSCGKAEERCSADPVRSLLYRRDRRELLFLET